MYLIYYTLVITLEFWQRILLKISLIDFCVLLIDHRRENRNNIYISSHDGSQDSLDKKFLMFFLNNEKNRIFWITVEFHLMKYLFDYRISK